VGVKEESLECGPDPRRRGVPPLENGISKEAREGGKGGEIGVRACQMGPPGAVSDGRQGAWGTRL